jgi:biopolymer transport protein ExbD
MANLNQAPGRGENDLKRNRLSVKIDMTPMVDLAFLLLTFFVLTTSLVKPFVVDITMPDERIEGAPLNQNRVLTVFLGANDKIYWYKGLPNTKTEVTDFSKNGIRKVLTEQKRKIKKIYVLIKPMETSKYKNVVDILDEFVITDIQHYSITSMSPEDEQLLRTLALH